MSETTAAARALAAARWQPKSPAERRESARATQDGLRRRFAREVDPDNRLPAAERAELVEQRRHEHFVQCGRASAAARRVRREAQGGGA
ncbi:hypothetical protein AB0C38_31770 [Amycolatopsis sp. NPDC048633]|uniref:hypothetical protein n=1 Tax=Amycolatopsis sp. NPDC048633 TaxID=3157095 RepID=UPI0033F4BABB